MALSGFPAMVTQASFFLSARLTAPYAVLKVPNGYSATSAMLALGELGAVCTVRLDHSASKTAII